MVMAVSDGIIPNALAAMYAVTQAYWKPEPMRILFWRAYSGRAIAWA
jgi:hypothetical protein